jgi:hypothetical protein
MGKIAKEELFRHLKGFLKTKGVDLQDGVYTERIRHGCDLLTETINVSQRALKQACVLVDRKLDRMRQVIHEKTAPRVPTAPPQPPAAASTKTNSARQPRMRRPRRRRRT